MSVPPHVTLAGVRAKLQRADKHIRDLEMLVSPLAKRATDSIVVEHDFNLRFEAGYPRWVYRVTDVPEMPSECFTLVGDALYNLRSALDHFAAQLAFREGVLPEDLDAKAYFPIHDTPLNGNGNPRNIGIPGVKDTAVIDVLKEIQPYELLQRHRQALWNQAFWLVNRLGNIDKHRLLLVMVHRMQIEAPDMPWWEGDNVAGFWMTLRPLKANDVVAWFDFRDVPHANFDPHISLQVSVGEGPFGCWPQARGVVELLDGLRWMVTNDLNWRFIHPFFPNERWLD